MTALNKNKIIYLVSGILLLVLILTGIFIFSTNSSDSKNKIIVTNFSNYSIMDGIDDDYEIVFLGEGQEIHDFEPTAKDIIKIKEAKYIIQNGSIDSWLDEIVENNDIDQSKVIKFLDDEEINPHIWLSPKQVISKINTIGEQTGFDTSEVSKDMIDLDIEYSELSQCSANKTFSADNTVEYIGLDYGFDISFLPEDYNIADVTEVVEGLNESSNKFILNGENDQEAETISVETGSEIIKVDIMEDKDSNSKESNIEILRDNLEKIKRSLNC